MAISGVFLLQTVQGEQLTGTWPVIIDSSALGWFGGGNGYISNVDRIVYAIDTPTSNPRGNLATSRSMLAACGNLTDGWFVAGLNGSAAATSNIDRINYLTDTVTASIRGYLTANRYLLAAAGNSTNGWFGGGYNSVPTIVTSVFSITYATDTTSTSTRGSLAIARHDLTACGNSTNGWFAGGLVAGLYQSYPDRQRSFQILF